MSRATPAIEIVRDATRALARGGGLEATLIGILSPLTDGRGIASAAVFTLAGPDAVLDIAASIGLGDPTALAAAVRNPAHPVTRTVAERASAFDVRPMAAGGPALRSHLLLILGEGPHGVVVGVLALAHDQPTDAEAQVLFAVVADLATVAVARSRATATRPGMS